MLKKILFSFSYNISFFFAKEIKKQTEKQLKTKTFAKNVSSKKHK